MLRKETKKFILNLITTKVWKIDSSQFFFWGKSDKLHSIPKIYDEKEMESVSFEWAVFFGVTHSDYVLFIRYKVGWAKRKMPFFGPEIKIGERDGNR